MNEGVSFKGNCGAALVLEGGGGRNYEVMGGRNYEVI